MFVKDVVPAQTDGRRLVGIKATDLLNKPRQHISGDPFDLYEPAYRLL